MDTSGLLAVSPPPPHLSRVQRTRSPTFQFIQFLFADLDHILGKWLEELYFQLFSKFLVEIHIFRAIEMDGENKDKRMIDFHIGVSHLKKKKKKKSMCTHIMVKRDISL